MQTLDAQGNLKTSNTGLANLTPARVVYGGADGRAAGDAELQWNTSGKRLVIGDETGAVGTTGAPLTGQNFLVLASNTYSNAASIFQYAYGITPTHTARRANGSIGAATAINANDVLFRISAGGHDGTNITASRAYLDFVASENYTPTQQGTEIQFFATPTTSVTPAQMMTLNGVGLGLGVAPTYKLQTGGEGTDPLTTSALHIEHHNSASLGPRVEAIRSTGTLATPAGVANGTKLFTIMAGGYYNSTTFLRTAQIEFAATETFSATAGGTSINFYVAPNAGVSPTLGMTLDQNRDLKLYKNLNMVGSAVRIYNDFDNNTLFANRGAFQTSTTNAGTFPGCIPNGTGTTSGFTFFNSSDPDNAARFTPQMISTAAQLVVNKSGTGSAVLPLIFNMYGTEMMRLLYTGWLGIGTDAPLSRLHVAETSTASPRGIISSQHNDGAQSSRFDFLKSRGTNASPTIIVTGDALAASQGWGYDGSNYISAGGWNVVTEGTIAATRVPSRMSFYTSTNATPSVVTERMRIGTAGNIGIGTTDQTTTRLYVQGSDASSGGTLYGFASVMGVTNTTTNGIGVLGRVDTSAVAFTLGASYSLYAANPIKGATSTITTAVGLAIENITSGTNNYSIYSSGGVMYHAGNVGIGVAPATNIGAYVSVSGASNGGSVYAVQGIYTATGTTGTAVGVYGRADTSAAAFTLTGAVSVYAANPTKGATSTISLAYGVYIADITSGGTNYSIYSAGGTMYHAGNVGINAASFGTSAASVLGIGNGTAPTTSPADMIQIYSVDLSAGNATLGLRTETAVVTESVVSDRTLTIKINGTNYKICLKA